MTKKKDLQSANFVVLQETAVNRFSALRPSFEGFEDFDSADAVARDWRNRYPHQTFVVLQCIARYTHVTRPVVTRMIEEPHRRAEDDVVQFPRSAASG